MSTRVEIPLGVLQAGNDIPANNSETRVSERSGDVVSSARVRHACANEEWRPVNGWETAYEVSSLGRVRSLPRGKRRGVVLSPATDAEGYQVVNLWHRGKQATRFVHRLVAEAFIGSPPDGMCVCHNNGQPDDNRPANLRIDTHSANTADQKRHGTMRGGNRLPRATRQAIYADLRRGRPKREIAEARGVCLGTVKNYKRRADARRSPSPTDAGEGGGT